MRSLIKSRLFFLSIVCLSSTSIFAQKIKIIDAFSQRPLEQVIVVNQENNRFTSSNEEGFFDLALFLKSDVLSFKLMGFETLTLSYEEVVKRKALISLFLDEKKLSEIVLSVARTAAQSEKIAEKVSVINTSDIRKETPSTGAELLLIAPSVRLQQSQGGGGSPVLRGFEANRVLLVVDGVRMNNAIFRSGHLHNAITVDPNSIERVEVVHGSSSVGYGSDALGGVIHYYTKTPRINNSKRFTHNFSTHFNSARNAMNHHLETESSFKNWASYSSISVSKFGDLRMGQRRAHGYPDWGLVHEYSKNTADRYFETPHPNPEPHIQKNMGYSQIDLLQKFVFNLPNENQLILNAQYSNSSVIPRFDKLNEYRDGALRFAEWNYGPQKRRFLSSQLKIYPRKKWLYKGTLTAAYQAVEESRIKRKFNTLSRETQKENVSVFSLNGDFEVKKNTFSRLSYGFEIVGNKITSTAFAQNLILDGTHIISLENKEHIPTRYPSDGSSYYSTALYGNYRYDITPKTTFSLGGRFTSTHLNAAWNDKALIDYDLDTVKTTNHALTGSTSVSYRPTSHWKLNLLFSSGFRSPNIDDLGKVRENNGFLLVANTDLKPEYVYNFDAGVVYKPPNGPLFLSLRMYNSSLRNYIGRMVYSISSDQSTLNGSTVIYSDEILVTQANINIGNARIYGCSLEGKLDFSEVFSLLGNISFTQATLNPLFGPLPSILPRFGRVEINYNKKDLSLILRHIFNSAKNPEDYSFGGEDRLNDTPAVLIDGEALYAGTPQWTTLSLLGDYQMSPHFRLKFALENIFDTHYRTFASGISAAGRSFNFGAAITF
ncbi:MAG: TonB-dependent receptor plug domain-containing protein [Flavobacteriaceae bacterium]